ncbi:membrane integrity-associated transporter subunit PqiC [Alteromonas sp. H39]|uniref:PqiC family protein n=1 Tax=Alteromonas sp. H39 TaxID=3389876 RepID=UPI0039E05FB2
MKVVALLCAAMLSLMGCASQPSHLQYYLLHSPNGSLKQHDDATVITLDQLLLPEYLKQRSLAIQTGSTTLHFSPKHVWAEPISNSFVQALSTALAAEGLNVLPASRRSLNEEAATVSIQIDDLISTWQGEVVLKGRYWVDTPDSDGVSEHFDYRIRLEQDGFPHAVDMMREAIIRLSADIAARVKT